MVSLGLDQFEEAGVWGVVRLAEYVVGHELSLDGCDESSKGLHESVDASWRRGH